VSARIGVAVEPIPQLFLYLRTGMISQVERLSFALDSSVWRLAPVSPELSIGAGFRAADRWQLALGMATARRPAASSTDRRGMTKLVFSTAFRFGP
jgi:hypothetical protein